MIMNFRVQEMRDIYLPDEEIIAFQTGVHLLK